MEHANPSSRAQARKRDVLGVGLRSQNGWAE
jgi:hypothetical protein